MTRHARSMVRQRAMPFCGTHLRWASHLFIRTLQTDRNVKVELGNFILISMDWTSCFPQAFLMKWCTCIILSQQKIISAALSELSQHLRDAEVKPPPNGWQWVFKLQSHIRWIYHVICLQRRHRAYKQLLLEINSILHNVLRSSSRWMQNSQHRLGNLWCHRDLWGCKWTLPCPTNTYRTQFSHVYQDKTRDTIEVWRTRPEIFLEHIACRGASTIPSPEILDRSEEYKMFHTMDDAFRTSVGGLAVCIYIFARILSAGG